MDKYGDWEQPESLWDLEAGTASSLSLYLRLSTSFLTNSELHDAFPPELAQEIEELVRSANVMCDNTLDWINWHELNKREDNELLLSEFLRVRVQPLTPEGQKLKMEMYNAPAADIIRELYETLMGRKTTYLALIRKLHPKCDGLLNNLQVMYDFVSTLYRRYLQLRKKWEK